MCLRPWSSLALEGIVPHPGDWLHSACALVDAGRRGDDGLLGPWDPWRVRPWLEHVAPIAYMAVTLAQASPQLRATVVDLPAVTPITAKLVAEAGATGHVTVRGADVIRGPVPGTYEVAIVRELLQVLSADEAQQVLQHIGAALISGAGSSSGAKFSMRRTPHRSRPWASS